MKKTIEIIFVLALLVMAVLAVVCVGIFITEMVASSVGDFPDTISRIKCEWSGGDWSWLYNRCK